MSPDNEIADGVAELDAIEPPPGNELYARFEAEAVLLRFVPSAIRAAHQRLAERAGALHHDNAGRDLR